MAGEAADPEGYKRKFIPKPTCIFHLHYCYGSMVCVDAAWSDSLRGRGISGSSESDRPGAFRERCGGRSADRSWIWNFMFLGNLKNYMLDVCLETDCSREYKLTFFGEKVM